MNKREFDLEQLNELNLDELKNVTGGGSIALKPGMTRERQEEMVRKHLREDRRHGVPKQAAIDDEIRLNNEISNTFLTSKDIIHLADEIYG